MKKLSKASIAKADIDLLQLMLHTQRPLTEADAIKIVRTSDDLPTLDRSIARLQNKLRHWSFDVETPVSERSGLIPWIKATWSK